MMIMCFKDLIMKRFLFICAIVFTFFSCGKKAEFIVERAENSDSTSVRNIKTVLPIVFEKTWKYIDLCKVVNAEVKGLTDMAIVEFDREAKSFYDEFVKDNIKPSAAKYEMFTDFDSFFSDSKTFSLRYSIYKYTAGAHGMTNYYSYVYDIQTSKRLKLFDVVKCDKESLNKINQLLKKNFRNPYDCFDKDPEIGKNFKTFNLVKDSLMFTFEQYMIGAYACGVAEVMIPIADLKKEGLFKR